MNTKFLRMLHKSGFNTDELGNQELVNKLTILSKMLIQDTVYMTKEHCMAFALTHLSLEDFIYEELEMNKQEKL